MFSNKVHNKLLTLDEVARQYRLGKNSLKCYRDAILEGKVNIPAEFIGLTENELREEFKKLESEIKKCAVFNILTTLEAEFKIDFLIRVQKRYKCSISRKFRKLYKHYKKQHRENKISLKEIILKSWKEEFPELRRVIDPYIEVLNYRHCLAHGRWWKPKIHVAYDEKYDFDTVYGLAQNIYESISFGERILNE